MGIAHLSCFKEGKVKYVYYYQTKLNENRQGEIKARDRADAYAQLRKKGIRPYRVVGDDPVRWQPWALAALILVLASVVAVLTTVIFVRDGRGSGNQRCQIEDDSGVVVKAFANGFEGVFAAELDNHLAMYAQPGWEVVPANLSPELLSAFTNGLSTSAQLLQPSVKEFQKLLKIVTYLRARLSNHIADGGSFETFFQILDENQELETALRTKAFEMVLNVRPELREHMLQSVNSRLRTMGMRPLDTFAAASEGQTEIGKE